MVPLSARARHAVSFHILGWKARFLAFSRQKSPCSAQATATAKVLRVRHRYGRRTAKRARLEVLVVARGCVCNIAILAVLMIMAVGGSARRHAGPSSKLASGCLWQRHGRWLRSG